MASGPCCIAHEFHRVASANPDRIVAVRAAGGIKVCKDALDALRVEGSDEVPRRFDFDGRRATSSHPPLYSGDEFFSSSELLFYVETLSRRLRAVLDGEDDPYLVRPRPQGYCHANLTLENSGSENDVRSSSSVTNDMNSVCRAPEIIGVFIGPSVEYIVAVLSILRVGEAFLPLDPLWPEERIQSSISSSRARFILKCVPDSWTEGSRGSDVIDWIVEKSGCSVLYVSMKTSIQEKGALSGLVWPCQSRSLRSFCYLMYTSGSTGKPKGVCGTEKGLLNRFWWMQEKMPLSGEDVLLFKTPISFIDHLQEFLSAILTCTALVIPPFNELRANPLHIVSLLKAYGISRITCVPSLLRVILPHMESVCLMDIQKSLKVLVLSGEVLSTSLWNSLHKFLPKTTILNLYGSTEVSGDCTYFDCSNLQKILDLEPLSSVPIGIPLSNCEIVLVGESDTPNEGEIYVGGSCLMAGYFDNPNSGHPCKDDGSLFHFRTGDIARRLQSGDFVFLGRKDRTVKVNGQRVALEEIENTLREHPKVIDAAVAFHRIHNDIPYIAAYIVLKDTQVLRETSIPHGDGRQGSKWLIMSVRSWLVRKLPSAMVPTRYFVIESLPIAATGKIDYAMLARPAYTGKLLGCGDKRSCSNYSDTFLQVIKQAFSDALLIEETSNQDDFFAMGGNSVSAAYVAQRLGIDMRLLYIFPSPIRLLTALLNGKDMHKNFLSGHIDSVKRMKLQENIWSNSFGNTIGSQNSGLLDGLLHMQAGEEVDELPQNPDIHPKLTNSSKTDEAFLRVCPLNKDSYPPTSVDTISVDGAQWILNINELVMCSFSRCNQFMTEGKSETNFTQRECLSIRSSIHGKGCIRELWKVLLRSCIDASPLIIVKDGNARLFVGSHSHMFLCIDALSGFVQWAVSLEGRIECSAAITSDFSQVVVGCYRGKIYFLDYMTGNMTWSFQTDGEVKMQPVVDKDRSLIWCGSHDHWLYALNHKDHCCIYKISCGGSIYGSPAIDMVRNIIYVASTSGRVTAISLEELPFQVSWTYESGTPIFGSLGLDSVSGNVICCLVNGNVIVMGSDGNILWKTIVDGPIFAGACLSSTLPFQVLICSRNGSVYSFDMADGALLWEYQTGAPITASAYIDEQICLASEQSSSSDRLACICSSTGSVHVLRIGSNIHQAGGSERPLVEEFAVLNLPGDVFSSPVMIGGHIFIGCRDDFVHCLRVSI